MPYANLLGLPNSLVAAYARRRIKCEACRVRRGRPCIGEPDGRVCRFRYREAVRELSAVAVDAVEKELRKDRAALKADQDARDAVSDSKALEGVG